STGWENVEAQANEPFQQMFGDFSLALYADFRPDVDRAGLDSRYRFLTRDFREIFQRFHDLCEISNPFPILAVPISHNETANATMILRRSRISFRFLRLFSCSTKQPAAKWFRPPLTAISYRVVQATPM